jgi:hypothetical protein
VVARDPRILQEKTLLDNLKVELRDISRQNLGEFPVGQQIASGILHIIEKSRVSQN